MEIGLALPQFDYSVAGESPLRWETVAAWARAAEARGFDSVWLADHLFMSVEKYGGPAGDHGGFDCLVGLAGLARVTTRVRLGTLVLAAPLRPAGVTAKSLAGLDVVSAGRLTVGVGAGWLEPEFQAAAVPFLPPGQRLAQLAETIQVYRGLWGGGPFAFAGRYVAVNEARCLPVPVQRPAPPVWVGGRGDRLIGVAARHGDGWNTVWEMTPERYRARLEVLDRACEAAGRDPAGLTRSLGLYTLVGESEADLAARYRRLQRLTPPGVVDRVPLDVWRQGRLVGTTEQVREQLAGWGALGVGCVIAGLGAVPFGVTTLDDLEAAAEALVSGPG